MEERQLSEGLAAENWIKAAIPLSAIMTGSADQLAKQAPTRETAIDLVDKLEASGEAYDTNDLLYAFESSADYDPAPKLNVINKPMLTINFADDLINPPELLNLPTASELHRGNDSIWPFQLRSHDTRAPCCLGFGSSVFSAAPPARTLMSVAIVRLLFGGRRR
jgi:homoserine acetyltransferase